METPRNTLLITGNSSGLGYGLTQHCLEQGWTVFGCSRSGCAGLQGALHDIRCDLTDFESIPSALSELLQASQGLDLVILNTGMMEYLCTEVDVDEFPAVRRIQVSRGSSATPPPEVAAQMIMDVIPELLNYPSGDFVDIRTL